jgi:hypothetical protein
MDYQIIRFNNGHRWDGSETWKGHSLSAVQDHAREIIEMGLAERVEVRDDNDVLVYQWPRTMKAAPTPSM